mgnify:CR=1 FL=1|jgi:hypothetical protein
MGMTFQLAILYFVYTRVKEYKDIFGDVSETPKAAKNQTANELAAIKRWNSIEKTGKKDKKKKKKDKKK